MDGAPAATRLVACEAGCDVSTSDRVTVAMVMGEDAADTVLLDDPLELRAELAELEVGLGTVDAERVGTIVDGTPAEDVDDELVELCEAELLLVKSPAEEDRVAFGAPVPRRLVLDGRTPATPTDENVVAEDMVVLLLLVVVELAMVAEPICEDVDINIELELLITPSPFVLVGAAVDDEAILADVVSCKIAVVEAVDAADAARLDDDVLSLLLVVFAFA